jgi:hypothetical protein
MRTRFIAGIETLRERDRIRDDRQRANLEQCPSGQDAHDYANDGERDQYRQEYVHHRERPVGMRRWSVRTIHTEKQVGLIHYMDR